MESRSQFTDTSKFLGSTYYFDQLGLDGQAILADIDRLSRVANPNADIADSRILGDSFVESELILKELKTLTNDSLLLSEDVVDDEEQVKELLDNAVSEFDALGIDASDVAVNGLTQEQIDSLSKDIVTFETVEVNGLTVLAPKIYLSLATRERLFGDASGDGESEGSLADGSVMFGKESFVIDAQNADVINNGTIRTGSTIDASGTSLGGNLTLNVASLTNRTNSISRARIISGNDLAITANDGDIKNLGAEISATANLNLSTVNGSIINSAIVQTNDANLLSQNVGLVGEGNTDLGDTPYQLAQGDYARSGGNITSTLLHNASITGGSITINAANDFSNLAASIVTNQNLLADASTTSGDLAITAGDDITIDTLQLRNRSERRWGNSKKGGIETKDYTSNIGSSISSAGNVSLTTTKLGIDSELVQDPTLTTSAISNINIVGSSISAANNITLLSADNANIISAQDSSSYFKAGSSSGKSYLDRSNSITQISSDLITLNNGNISITSGVNNSDVIGAENSTGSIAIIASNLTTSDVDGDTSNNVGSGNISLIAKEDVTITSAADTFYEEKITSKKGTVSKKGSTDITQTLRNISSILSSNNDINITSGDDLNIIASELTAVNDGNLVTGKYLDEQTNIENFNEGGQLNIISAKDLDYKYHNAFSSKVDFEAIAVGAVVGFLVGGPTGMVVGMAATADSEAGSSSFTETSDETLISSKITIGNNLNINSASDVNIVSSDLTSGNDMNIVARSGVNIIADQEVDYESTSFERADLLAGFSIAKIDSTSTNISSDINAGSDLVITSGDDVNVAASNITASGNGSITAGKYLDSDILSATYNTEIFNKDANVNILNGVDTAYSYSNSTKTSTTIDLETLAVAYLLGGGLLMLSSIENTTKSYSVGNLSESVAKSNLSFGNGLTISSGNNINVRASDIEAGILAGEKTGNQGDVNLFAGLITTTDFNTEESTLNSNEDANVNILSDVENSTSYTVNEVTSLGGENIDISHDKISIGSYTRNTNTNSTATQISSSIISNNGNINISAQNDLNILASNLATSLDSTNEEDVNLGQINLITQNGNTNILSAYNTNSNDSESLTGDVVLRFELDSTELAFLAGVEIEGTKDSDKTGTVISSNILGSAVNIVSGSSLDSDSINLSDKGNININSANISAFRDNVTLLSFNDTNLTTSSNYYEQTHSDFTLDVHVRAGVSYNFKEVWQSVEALKDVKLENAIKYLGINAAAGYLGAGAASPYVATYGPALLSMGEGDSLDEYLAENGEYLNDANTINNAGKGGSGSAGITVEVAYNESKSGSKQTSVVSNNIFSNNDINLTSNNSDLNIASSYLTALNDINLNAREGNINITANSNDSDSFSRSFGFTVSIPLYGKGGAASINFAKSKSESSSYVNSSLIAGNDFNLNSKEDTNIISSNILASNINMTVGGNLNLESKQNTSKSKATSFGIGGGYSSSGGSKSGSGSLSYSRSTANRKWVDNQASILGTSSVTINVGETTNLIGSIIANSTNGRTSGDGIDGGNLTLNTKLLTYTDLMDIDKARSFGIGVSGNARGGGGQKTKGSTSLALDYSMHDFRQDSNSTIGSGDVNEGTTLNLDSNNNLVSVTGGESYDGNINRNIKIAQLTTKHLEVKPISIKETYEFGRNSTDSVVASSDGEGNSDSSNAASITDNSKNTLSYKVGVSLFGEENANLVGAALNSKYLVQINPLRGFTNITDGIVSDVRNIAGELDIEPKVANIGEDNKYITVDKDGNRREFTIEELKENPSLASNKVFANGVMNTLKEAISNAVEQLGGYDKDGRITISYDPTAAPEAKFTEDPWGNIGGFLADSGEVAINYFGAGIFVTKGQDQDQKFIETLTNNAKLTGDVVTLAGHSAGGRRNYITLLNSNPDQYKDSNGRSVLEVKFAGTPANNYDLKLATENSGAEYVGSQNKSADPVGNLLGGNGSILDAGMSVGGSALLFGWFESIGLPSQHSHYGCTGSHCDGIKADLSQFTYDQNLNNNQPDSDL